MAVKEADFKNYHSSIIVKETYHTGTGWEIRGNQGGYFNEKDIRDIIIIGDLPSAGHPIAVNSFLCEVRFLGMQKYELDGALYEAYEIVDWYPVYPVVRSRGLFSEFIYSKKFLREDELEIY